MTGSPDGGNLFSFADRTGEGGDGRGIVSYYNMNNVVSRPSSASFEWNGETKETLGNTFVLGRSLEVSMYAPGDQAAQISYIPDSDKILDGVSGIIRSYNKLVDSTNNYSGQTGQSPRLIREYQNLLKPYLSELESCGIMAYPLEYMSPKIPGLGDVDWGKYVSALTDIGYDGCTCIEIEDKAFEDSKEKVEKSLILSKRYLEKYVI